MTDREKQLIDMLKNLSEKFPITPRDIANVITATHGTRVTIIPDHNDGQYVRWTITNEAGAKIESNNLCPHPKLDEEDQYDAARRMIIDEQGVL